jgi:hypothetical protein
VDKVIYVKKWMPIKVDVRDDLSILNKKIIKLEKSGHSDNYIDSVIRKELQKIRNKQKVIDK